MKARIPKGYGAGGPSNMQDMMRQAQKMQENLKIKQAEIDEKEFAVSAGGGVVELTINGKKQVTGLKLKEEVVDPTDIEMLEDLIISAVNEGIRQVEEYTNNEMEGLTGGVSLPGIF